MRIRAVATFSFDVPDDARMEDVRAEFDAGLARALMILRAHEGFDDVGELMEETGPGDELVGTVELHAEAA